MNTNKILTGILLLSLISFLPGCNQQSEEQTGKPNIVFIMADDMGVADAGCYGNKLIETPNLDRMAGEGIRFTHHYAGCTVCAPSRGSLMTGMHSGQAYIKGNFAMQIEGNLPLPDTTLTVAELLMQAGYRTAVIGKWGLGGPGSVGGPNNQGFDYSCCYLDQRNAHEYYPPYLWENEHKVLLDNQDNQREYSHDLFTGKALDYLEKQGDKPFFLYLPYTIPHGKYQIPDEAPYADRDWSGDQKTYAAMITRMDRDIGKIMELIESKGMDDQTIIFFTSDNGPVKRMADFFKSKGNLRGYKGDLFEGGIRAPLIVRWPGKIQKGRVSDHISAFWDFLPTACDLAGIELPININGISYLPELMGEQQPEHEHLYWEYFRYHYGWQPGNEGPRNSFDSQAVRMGNWKGIRMNVSREPDGPIQLYNLAQDQQEKYDVAEEYPEIVDKIRRIMSSAHQDTEFFQTAH